MTQPFAHLTGRVRPDIPDRLDRIAAEMSSRVPGVRLRRADALRVAVERGVEVLERELGIAPDEAPAATSTPKGGKRPASKPAK